MFAITILLRLSDGCVILPVLFDSVHKCSIISYEEDSDTGLDFNVVCSIFRYSLFNIN